LRCRFLHPTTCFVEILSQAPAIGIQERQFALADVCLVCRVYAAIAAKSQRLQYGDKLPLAMLTG